MGPRAARAIGPGERREHEPLQRNIDGHIQHYEDIQEPGCAPLSDQLVERAKQKHHDQVLPNKSQDRPTRHRNGTSEHNEQPSKKQGRAQRAGFHRGHSDQALEQQDRNDRALPAMTPEPLMNQYGASARGARIIDRLAAAFE